MTTDMDYEQKYKRALERAREYFKAEGFTEMTDVFPELIESEDERIRKLLVWQVYRNIEDETNDLAQSVYDGIKGHDPDIEESIEDWKKCLAYLEKQKENPKSADSFTDGIIEVRSFQRGMEEGRRLKQKEQKPAEWSEEDERKRLACIETINEVIDYERERWEDYNPGKPYRPIMKYDEQIAWLKSLRPSWKPSEEQMKALQCAIAFMEIRKASDYDITPLKSLYEQLKKLM